MNSSNCSAGGTEEDTKEVRRREKKSKEQRVHTRTNTLDAQGIRAATLLASFSCPRSQPKRHELEAEHRNG